MRCKGGGLVFIKRDWVTPYKDVVLVSEDQWDVEQLQKNESKLNGEPCCAEGGRYALRLCSEKAAKRALRILPKKRVKISDGSLVPRTPTRKLQVL